MPPPVSLDPLAIIAEDLTTRVVELLAHGTIEDAASQIYATLVAVREGRIREQAMVIMESGDLPIVRLPDASEQITEPPVPLVRTPTGDLPSEPTEYLELDQGGDR